MNAGFSNLDFLRGQILASSQAGDDSFDAKLMLLGKGVAAAFENYCNRKFCRQAACTETFGADRCQFLLSRFPVEPPIGLVEFKLDEPTGWVTQDQTNSNDIVIQTLDEAAGIIYIPDGADAGPYYSQVRFTYTGGYFWETLEPTDNGYPSQVPTGANALPLDLQAAWILQVEDAWKKKDQLGRSVFEGNAKTLQRISPAFLQNAWLPTVKSMISQYIRPQMV